MKKLLFKPIFVFKADMDQFEEKEMTKKRTFGKKHDIHEPVKNGGWCLRKYYESF